MDQKQKTDEVSAVSMPIGVFGMQLHRDPEFGCELTIHASKGKTIGFVRFGRSEDPADPTTFNVWEIDIHDHMQNHGIGTELLRRAVEIVKADGAATVEACCTSLVSLRTFVRVLGAPFTIQHHDEGEVTAIELLRLLPIGPVRLEGQDVDSVIARWKVPRES